MWPWTLPLKLTNQLSKHIKSPNLHSYQVYGHFLQNVCYICNAHLMTDNLSGSKVLYQTITTSQILYLIKPTIVA